jgi:hypothetical protein
LKRTYEGLPDFRGFLAAGEVFRIFDLQLLFKINWNNCEHLVGEKKANGF